MATSLSPLHLVGNFSNTFTGAERELPDLADLLKDRRPTRMWSVLPPHPSYARLGVLPIKPFGGQVPRGGMLLIGGVHVGLDLWLKQAQPERVALRYNLGQHERLYAMIDALRDVTGLEPELLFVSQALRLGAGLPGTIERSLIRLEPYLQNPIERAPHPRFTIGRVSRDTPEKHHKDDPALYRMLAARGYQVRIMGGTCLAPQLAGVPGVELLPAGAEEVPAFYQTLDAMFYRPGIFNEPYGRVVFEAMASGLPVVASAVGGYAECMDDGVNGFLVRSQEQAIERLEMLANNKGLSAYIGRAARQRAIQLHGSLAIEAQLQYFLSY
ncbi:MAG: glycosyltransferase [Bdellovibrionales bacterium]|nr:glycosyltransferase [Ramlibacter sp.]